MATNDANKLLSQYKTSINSDILEKFTKIKEINDKYQLTSGTEVDFNNAAKFLFYAQTKNNKPIDANETQISSGLSNSLIKYYNEYLTNDDIAELANYVYYYNKKIDDEYSIDISNGSSSMTPESIKKVMTNIYGINYDTFEIKNRSYAHRLQERIKKNYVEYIVNYKQAYINDLAVNIIVKDSYKYNQETQQYVKSTYAEQKAAFVTMTKENTFKYKNKYNIYPTYYLTSETSVYYVITENSLIKYERTNEKVCKNKLQYWTTDDKCYTYNTTTHVYDETAYEFGKKIQEFFVTYTNNVGARKTGINSTTETVPSALAGLYDSKTETYNYAYDIYEQNFLIMVTYDYILTRITNSGLEVASAAGYQINSTGTEVDYTLKTTTTKNNDNSEILYSDIQSGTYIYANNYDVGIRVSAPELQVSKIINIGNLNDPSISDVNADENYLRNILHAYNSSGTEITLTNAQILELYPTNRRRYISTNRTAYYTLDIDKIYNNYTNIYSISLSNGSGAPTALSDVVFNKGSETHSKHIYENDIKNTYYDYFLPKTENIENNDGVYTLNSNKSALYETLTNGVDSDGAFDKEYKVMKHTFKIFFEFVEPVSKFSDDVTFDTLKLTEKRNSSSVETYQTLNYANVNYYNLENLIVETNSDAYKLLKKLYDYDCFGHGKGESPRYSSTNYSKYGFGTPTTINGVPYTIISINFIYKELNTEIREIESSDIQNKILGKYIYSNKSSIVVTTDLYDVVTNTAYMDDMEDSDKQIFLNLYSNDYIIRSSVSDDIVAYLAGESIGFGTNSQSKQDIEQLRLIYKETRDYFYKVLLNKAFTVEPLYDVYKQLYIKAFTIERFISRGISNTKDIELYNDEDCRNFLISYGLKILSDQVDNYSFLNSISYKKRLIANYNNLMSEKGSKGVIDEFFKIFNYDTTDIEIYKYLLIKENTFNVDDSKKIDSDAIKFVSVPYAATNINAALKEYSAKSKPYSEFIANDKYWDSNDISETDVKQVVESPVNTKYLGIDLKKDIYMSYIKSKYILSLNDYLYDSLFYYIKDSEQTERFYTHLVAQTNMFGKEMGIIALYKLTKLLFSEYIYVCENNSRYNIEDTFNYTTSNGLSYYGISKTNFIGNPNIDFGFYTNTFLNKSLTEKLFKTTYVKYSDGAYKMSSDLVTPDYIDFYATTESFKPYDFTTTLTSGTTNYANAMSKIIFGESGSTTYGTAVTDIIPLSVNTTIDNCNFSTKTFDNFKSNLNEITTTSFEKLTNNSISAFSQTDEVLQSLSLVNFINKNYYTKDSVDMKDYCDKLQAIYYFNKLNSRTYYPTNFNEIGEIKNDISLGSDNFYKYIYNNILTFPFKYLDGAYGNHANNMYYFNDVRVIFDELFEKFYTVSNTEGHDPIGYLTGEDSDADYFFENLRIFYKEGIWDSTIISKSIIENLFCGLITLADSYDPEEPEDNPVTINTIAFTDELITNVSNNLMECATSVNNAVNLYENMKLEFQFSENTTNLFDFIKTCVEFFISYTSTLYESNLIYKIDTKNERIPMSYKIEDIISNNSSDYFYYDESITIDEFEEESE